MGEPAAQAHVDVHLREVARQSDSANITTIYRHHTTHLWRGMRLRLPFQVCGGGWHADMGTTMADSCSEN